MRDEIFDINFDYNKQQYTFTIKTDLPFGPEPFGCNYDVYHGRKHLYTLNHCKNEDEIHCWEIRKRPTDEKDSSFAQAIGKAIDQYYGI